MNADGTDVRRLTSTPGVDELDPSYSPDGRMIAYYRRPEQGDDSVGEIWVMNADGSGQHLVALGANPEWSTLQGGAGKPRIQLRTHRLNRRRRCLGRLDGFSARVRTDAPRLTRFHVAIYVDGRLVDEESNSRGIGTGVEV